MPAPPQPLVDALRPHAARLVALGRELERRAAARPPEPPATTFSDTPDDDDGGLPGDSHLMFSESVETFGDRTGLVRRQIDVHRNGKTFKQWRWVDPDTGGPGKAPATADTGARAEHSRRLEAAHAAIWDAQDRPHELTAESLKELAGHLEYISPAHAREVARQMGLRLGGRKAALARRILDDIRAKRGADGRPGVGEGSPGVPRPPAADGGQVAGTAERPGPASPDQGGGGGSQPAGDRPVAKIPADAGEVNRRIDRFANLFRSRGQDEAAGWMDKLKSHVAAVGVEGALESLGEDKGKGAGGGTQYEGGWETMGDFAEAYLNRHGITPVHQTGYDPDPNTPTVSSASPNYGGTARGPAGSFTPKDPTLEHKLAEAKKLPGLETSEDINVLAGKPVTHLTPDVTAKLDETYGAAKWIVKAYGDDAAAGYGIFFPQRAEQIAQDARNTLWNAGEALGRYGFHLRRDEAGKVVGLEHANGDRYDFGPVERWEEEDADGKKHLRFRHAGTERYNATIDGDAKDWADRAAEAADNERAAVLPGGGKEFMAQPAFPVVGVSDADRAAGVTIKAGQEGRVHVVTRNGKAEVVPHSTWLKKEWLPVVFETDDTRAMAKAAQDAIDALPESERNGQIYAPDIVRTATGYKVVEANPANHTGSSGYLGNSPFVIDAYVSHLTGRTPAHVQFIRKLLTARDKSGGDGRGPAEGTDAAGKDQRGGAGGGAGGDRGVGRHDPGGAGGVERTQPANAHPPETLAEKLTTGGVAPLPDAAGDGGRWDHAPEVRDEHNRQVLAAAKASGTFVPPEAFARVTAAPNVGGMEHDVHEDHANGRFFKFTKGGHFGQNKDVHEYLDRHRIANQLWPELDHKFHGVTQSPFDGHPQAVMSMNRVEGTHPEQHEIADWFTSHGWVPNEEDDPEHGIWSWRDPKTGHVVNDAHTKNFVKTAKGLVPIDVDILPGGAHR